jgi:STE24 endopeptidase
MLLRRFGLTIAMGFLIASFVPRRARADSPVHATAGKPLPTQQQVSSRRASHPASSERSTAPAYTLPPDQLAKAMTLSRLRTLLAFGGTAWSILILILVLALRWPALLRNWVERITPRLWLQGLIFLCISILFLVVVPMPLEIYGHHTALAYGLSIQKWNSWVMDQIKMLLLSLLVFVPLLLLLFVLLRRSPWKWWFWFWLCTIPVIIFAVFISPMWIDPMFNHFSPLQKSDPQLTMHLEQLVQHAGLDIPPSRIYLMRASDKVTGLNAYVTGIGASKRIVVWDNTVRKLPPDQILFIVGHEMGHYVLNHIYKGLAFTAFVLFIALWLASLSTQWLIRRYALRWGIRGTADWAALGVLVLVFTCFNFLLSPLANSFSRWEEHQADIYGQESIHGLVVAPQQTAQRAFTALGSAYLEAPNANPWLEFWLDSHPSTSERFRFAAHYDPWLPGGHPRYFRK